MTKFFKDFTFDGKKFSDLQTKYVSVSFDSDSDTSLGMERDMEKGESSRYHIEPNYFYDKWSDGLVINLYIVKDPDIYTSQQDKEITPDEVREITRWLTSKHVPDWIDFVNFNSLDTAYRYKGWFKNIESWTVSNAIYGLSLSFQCTTPFGYTDEIVNTIDVSSYKQVSITNDSDELDNYCYPTIEIYPKSNGQIYVCNLSDCALIKEGVLQPEANTTYFDSMLDIIEEYGTLKGYTVEYTGDNNDAYNIIPLCDDTAVQFYYVDRYGNKTRCTAFYLPDTYEYRIISGGFMYMAVYKDLPIFIDCQRLFIHDELLRMITYDNLGITDAGGIYWIQLKNGINDFMLYGNCSFVFKHIESRKVGA